MGISKKMRKAPLPKPPLSFIDKLIYGLILVGGFLWMFLVMHVFGEKIPRIIAFSDPAVKAFGAEFPIWCLPLAFLGYIFLWIVALTGITVKQPIFGNKRFKPKFGVNVIKMYPFFSKDFWQNLSDKYKKRINTFLFVSVISLAVCALVLFFGIFPRKVVDGKNNFISYDSLNRVTETHNITGVDEMTVEITRTSRKRRVSYHLYVRFTFDDKTYSLPLGCLEDAGYEETLEYMLYLKSLVPQSKRYYENAKWISELAARKEFTSEEKRLLYELFDEKDS
jgi:hypothetical protein